MVKKNDTTNIKNLGKGILDTLTSINEEKSKEIRYEKNNTVNAPKSTTALDQKSKRVNIENNKSIRTQNNNTIEEEKDKSLKGYNGEIIKETSDKTINKETNKSIRDENSKLVNKEKNKTVKEKKNKRSFMLTEKSIQKLSMLNMALNNKDLSTIVDEAINLYFDENRYKIEELISKYNSLK